MQAQAYEGYIEDGQFYTKKDNPIRITGRFKAILTVLDAPMQADTDALSRMEWLNRLETAVALSTDEDLPDWAFERSKEMRTPLDFEN